MRRLTRKKAEEVVLRAGWLSVQPPEFQAEVLQRCALQTFPAETVIYRLNDPPGGIYGLVAGALSVVSDGGPGAPLQVQYASAGGWIGILPFLTGETRRAGIAAVTDCAMLHLPLATMEAMVARESAWVRNFAQIAVWNLKSAIELVHHLLITDTGRRIAAVLLRAARSGADPIPISQGDLAAMSNTSRRQVNTALQRFAADGWIVQGYRSVSLVDREALSRYIARGEA